jgi:hypothetical protein
MSEPPYHHRTNRDYEAEVERLTAEHADTLRMEHAGRMQIGRLRAQLADARRIIRDKCDDDATCEECVFINMCVGKLLEGAAPPAAVDTASPAPQPWLCEKCGSDFSQLMDDLAAVQHQLDVANDGWEKTDAWLDAANARIAKARDLWKQFWLQSATCFSFPTNLLEQLGRVLMEGVDSIWFKEGGE